MEVTAGGSSDGGRPRRSTAVPSCYHRPSAGSCHHVCKYGGAHTFDDQERDQPRRAAQSKPRKQPPSPSPAPAPATAVVLGKLRSASSRRRVGDLLITKPDKVSKKPVAAAAVGDDDSVVWKDIMAYDSPEKIAVVGEAKKKDGSVIKGKKSVKSSHGKAKIVAEETTGGDNEIAANKKPHGSAKKKNHLIKSKLQAADTTTSPSDISDKSKNTKVIKSSSRTKNVKPPKPKKNLPQIGQQITQQNSPSPSPSPSPSSSDIKEEQKPPKPLAEEAKSGKPAPAPPPPAHRRAKSMSITGTKSVRFPFTRHASKSSTTFKVIRSKSSRTTLSPPESTPAPATRLKFFRRGDAGSNSSNNGSGIQLKIRSLRRRGSSRSGGTAATGFSVPAVVLRHQKTLEKKRSRRLYNSVIEETAGKLVKARKSRVKALVGAFESLISKIGK